ncbi:uncharacterized protein LOC135843793 [Planococcus citri]|uniref:uncharacterized protein LOC135843793 n=1 Tax=Planococcus citri TaxID=170843 RepID=UPI0031F98250
MISLHIIFLLICALYVKYNHAWAYRSKFDELRMSPFFIDKTEFLRLLFDPSCSASADQFYFITAPHRFSKSTLLRMTQSFCEMELDSNGDPKPYSETEAYKVFKDTRIFQYSNLVQKNLASYPVIFLDMTKYAAMHQSHRKIAVELNDKFLDAIKPFNLRLERIQRYIREGYPDNYTMSISSRRFIETLYARNMTIQTLDSSLMLLVKFLYELFDNRQVILLIDEYDNTALRSYIFQRGYTARNYRKLNKILFKLIKGGKNFIRNIVMMGVSSLAFASDDILPKHMTHMCFLNDHSVMPYLGVTETELTDIFDKYQCCDEERAAIVDYYRPYRTAIKKAAVYHPYSLNSYFTLRTLPVWEDALKPHWRKLEGQGLNAPFYKSELFRKTIDDILSNKTVRLKLRKQQPGNALDQLELLRDQNFQSITDEQVFIFIRLYFELGYISHADRDSHAYIIPNNDARMIVEFDREVYWSRFAKRDLNVTLPPTMRPPSQDQFFDDPDVVPAAESGISLVEEEPLDPDCVPPPPRPERPRPERPQPESEEEEEETTSATIEPITYDLRSRYKREVKVDF